MQGVPGLGLCGAQGFQRFWAWEIERLRNGALCVRPPSGCQLGVICWPFRSGKGDAGGGGRAGEHAIQKLGDKGFGFRVKEHAVGELGDKGLLAQKICAGKNAQFRPEAHHHRGHARWIITLQPKA